MYASTIAKIENGHRAVRPDELAAFADLFGMSTDILLGRSGSASDVLWAASKLSSNAQKMIGEVEHLQSRLLNDLQDLNVCITRDKHPMIHMHDTAHRASLALQGAADALAAVAGEFPIPGGIA